MCVGKKEEEEKLKGDSRTHSITRDDQKLVSVVQPSFGCVRVPNDELLDRGVSQSSGDSEDSC